MLYPDISNHEQSKIFRETLLAALDYLCDQCSIEKRNLNQTYPNWTAYAHYSAALNSLQDGNIENGRSRINKAIDNLSTAPLQIKVSPLGSDEASNAKLSIIQDELRINSDKPIGIGQIPDDKISIAHLSEKMLKASLEWMQDIAAEFYDELKIHCNEIILSWSTKNHYIQSASSFNMFGLVIMHIDENYNTLHYFEHLIHEAAHLKLFTITPYDEIIKNSGDKKYQAPFREDPRPMSGIFHAYFVLARIIICLHRLIGYKNCHDQYSLNTRIQELTEKFFSTHTIIKNHAIFTKIGNDIFSECYFEILQISSRK